MAILRSSGVTPAQTSPRDIWCIPNDDAQLWGAFSLHPVMMFLVSNGQESEIGYLMGLKLLPYLRRAPAGLDRLVRGLGQHGVETGVEPSMSSPQAVAQS